MKIKYNFFFTFLAILFVNVLSAQNGKLLLVGGGGEEEGEDSNGCNGLSSPRILYNGSIGSGSASVKVACCAGSRSSTKYWEDITYPLNGNGNPEPHLNPDPKLLGM
jgi:hypothetical protein